MAKKKRKKTVVKKRGDHYSDVLASMVDLLESARRASARAVNCVMTATYWEIGRRIVELEQGGEDRAEYGEELVKKLAKDLSERFGRGFGVVNLSYMRRIYQCWPTEKIFQTLSEKSSDPIFQTLSEKLGSAGSPKSQTVSGESCGEILQTLSAKLQPIEGSYFTAIEAIAACFPLPWSHYVKLLSIDDENARRFYEEEALRGGWSVRQLNRQINILFYERAMMSKNKAAMLRKGVGPIADDFVSPEEEIKDPFVLEFLDLKDEYSETDLEEALIHHLEGFLLELGSDFTFVGRQRRCKRSAGG